MRATPANPNEPVVCDAPDPGITGAAEVFVARQPILTSKMRVYGYELLYRNGAENAYMGTDGAAATSHVITSTFLNIGMERLVQNARAFINFDRKLLLSSVPFALPPDRVVIELLETIEPDDAVMNRCAELRQRGYMLALDDVVSADRCREPLVRMAHIMKVDVCATDESKRRELATTFLKNGKVLLAEKVETPQEFEAASRLGFAYFQGYFFARPKTVHGPDVRPSSFRRCKLLECTSAEDFSLESVEQILAGEAELAYQLLRYLNSARFAWRDRIRSVRHALALLGVEEIRRWSAIVALCGIARGRPEALLSFSVIRARFCEVLAKRTELRTRSSELFLMGLMSLLDAILNCPMQEIVSGLPLAADIKDALVGASADSAPAVAYALVKATERGDSKALAPLARAAGLADDAPAQIYWEAVEWTSAMEL